MVGMGENCTGANTHSSSSGHTVQPSLHNTIPSLGTALSIFVTRVSGDLRYKYLQTPNNTLYVYMLQKPHDANTYTHTYIVKHTQPSHTISYFPSC